MKVTKRSLGRLASVVAATAVAATALAGCSAGSANLTSSGSSSITVWVDANRGAALKPIAAQFKKDTGVTVKMVVKDASTVSQDFISQVPTGKGPDIIVAPHDGLGSYVQNGVVQPIQIPDTSKYEKTAIEAVTYNGQIYGLPYSLENIALLRNKKLAPSAPATFADAVTAGRAAVAANPATVKYPFLFGLDPKNADPYHLYPLESSFGSSVFQQKSDGTYDGSKLTLGDSSGLAFAASLKKWGSDGSINPNITGDIALEAFDKGESPYYVTGPWNLAAIKKAGIDYSIDPLPSAGGQPAKPFLGVNAFFLSAKTTNKVAATKFMVDYLGTDSVQEALYKSGDRPPALISAYNKVTASDPDMKALGAISKNAEPMPSIPQMAAVWNDWGVAEAQILRGADPATTWSQMATNIAAKIK